VSESDKIDVAVTLLSGTALEWWQAVERNSGNSLRNITWSEFEERCVKRFQPQPIAASESEAAMQRLLVLVLVWRQTNNVTAYINATDFRQSRNRFQTLCSVA
jgi:hypothetical protein